MGGTRGEVGLWTTRVSEGTSFFVVEVGSRRVRFSESSVRPEKRTVQPVKTIAVEVLCKSEMRKGDSGGDGPRFGGHDVVTGD